MKNLVQMDQLINTFAIQLQEAMEIGKASKISKSDDIDNLVVAGLGGSGIGADLTNEIATSELRIPMNSIKGYHLPNYVGPNTLVIISSYSGNTEETLSCLEDAISKRAQIVCISSGGQIIERAKKEGIEFIVIPGGNPPRACLGYSFVQQLYVLLKKELISNSFEDELFESIQILEGNKSSIKAKAEEIAEKIYNKFPVIYAEDQYESIAVRMRQQLNENSKMLCFHHVVPEMNHNELVGWRDVPDKLIAIVLRSDIEHSSNTKRIEISKEIIRPLTNDVLEIWTQGDNNISKRLYLIHLIDWISFYTGVKRKFDPVEVNVIDRLKKKLAKS